MNDTINSEHTDSVFNAQIKSKQDVMHAMSELFHIGNKQLTIKAAVKLAEQGAIPDKRESFEGKDDDGLWRMGLEHTYDEYFLTCFIKELGRSGIKNEPELRERLEELENADNPNKNYSDGSAGQWKVSNQHNIETVKWLLNEA